MIKQSAYTESHTDLGIANELRDKQFRDQFFRTERELDIPAQLRALRKMRGLNQGQLAQMVGTKQSGISRLERSSHGHGISETLVKIAEALDARLAVVIEPYETVVARYQIAGSAEGDSAATAQTQGASPTMAQTQGAPRVSDAPKEPDRRLAQKTNKKLAGGEREHAWNW